MQPGTTVPKHHHAKQVTGWHLDQPQPGTMTWTLPHGRTYQVRPEPYPGEGPGARAGPGNPGG